MLTPFEAFKYGFLCRCADEKLRPDEIDNRIKTAALKLASLGDIAKSTLGVFLLPLVAAAATGVGAGYTGHKLLEPNYDPDELENRELINAYETAATQIKLRRQAEKMLNPGRGKYRGK